MRKQYKNLMYYVKQHLNINVPNIITSIFTTILTHIVLNSNNGVRSMKTKYLSVIIKFPKF